jgi:hypothetical protein
MELQLSKLIHRKIVVIGPKFFDQEKLETVTLLAVEDAGIWIESAEAANVIVKKFGVKPSSSALAFFIPFSQITTILASFDSTATAAETTTIPGS